MRVGALLALAHPAAALRVLERRRQRAQPVLHELPAARLPEQLAEREQCVMRVVIQSGVPRAGSGVPSSSSHANPPGTRAPRAKSISREGSAASQAGRSSSGHARVRRSLSRCRG